MSDKADMREISLMRVDWLGTLHASGILAFTGRLGSRLHGFRPDWLRGDFEAGQFPAIPWFLDDQRPQGFLGHQLANRLSVESGLPSDVTLWCDDVVLDVLVAFGRDCPGNFVIGSHNPAAMEPSRQTSIPQAERQDSYSELALAVLSASDVGPLAAGEQPMFTTTVLEEDGSIRHVIVKFSEAVENNPTAPVGRPSHL